MYRELLNVPGWRIRFARLFHIIFIYFHSPDTLIKTPTRHEIGVFILFLNYRLSKKPLIYHKTIEFKIIHTLIQYFSFDSLLIQTHSGISIM